MKKVQTHTKPAWRRLVAARQGTDWSDPKSHARAANEVSHDADFHCKIAMPGSTRPPGNLRHGRVCTHHGINASETLTQTHAITPRAALWPVTYTPALLALRQSSDRRQTALAQQTHPGKLWLPHIEGPTAPDRSHTTHTRAVPEPATRRYQPLACARDTETRHGQPNDRPEHYRSASAKLQRTSRPQCPTLPNANGPNRSNDQRNPSADEAAVQRQAASAVKTAACRQSAS